MALIHYIVVGHGEPPIVLVPFACAHTDWDAQVAHLAPYHQTIAVDLRGHGASPGSPNECLIERYGAMSQRSCTAWTFYPPCWSAIPWDARGH